MLPILNALIKRTWIVGMLISLMVLNGCKDSDKNSSLIFEELSESLERSNENLKQDIAVSLRYLKQLTEKPETAEKGIFLLSKAKMIESYSLGIVALIDSLSKVIGGKINANSFVNERREKNFISDIFIEEKNGEKLYKSIINYRKDILNVDERIKREFEEKISVADKKFKTLFQGDKEFTKTFFEGATALRATAVLSKYRNDVLTTEYQTILFLKNSICILNIIYDDFTTTITSQNSKHFKSRDELIIKTGVGTFKTGNIKEIIINNSIVNVIYGMGIYKTKVENKPGRYQIPVKIVLTTQDGKTENFSDFVEYTVDK